MQKANH